MTVSIGELRESSLHEELKEFYQASFGGETEVPVDGYIVDLYTGSEVIEIQTGSFSNISGKLSKLLGSHPVRLVHPLVRRKSLLLYDQTGTVLQRQRRSPLRGIPAHAARELIRIPDVAMQPGFTFELLMVSVEETRRDDGKGSWRRKGVSIADRKLLSIDDVLVFEKPADYLKLLPPGLPDPFTNKDTASLGGMTASQASKLSWFLRKVGVVEAVGKEGRAYLFHAAAGV